MLLGTTLRTVDYTMKDRTINKIKGSKIKEIEVISMPGLPGHKVDKIQLENGMTLKFTTDNNDPVVVVWSERGRIIR